jgi:hypothetical protein
MRPPRGEPRVGERRQHEDIEVRLVGEERAARRHHFDDPSAVPSHAPPIEARGDFEDICRHLEAVL